MAKQSIETHHINKIGGTNLLISIHYQDHQSFQGVVQWLDTGKTVHFRSGLELLNLIQEATQAGKSYDDAFRTWNEDASSQVISS